MSKPRINTRTSRPPKRRGSQAERADPISPSSRSASSCPQPPREIPRQRRPPFEKRPSQTLASRRWRGRRLRDTGRRSSRKTLAEKALQPRDPPQGQDPSVQRRLDAFRQKLKEFSQTRMCRRKNGLKPLAWRISATGLRRQACRAVFVPRFFQNGGIVIHVLSSRLYGAVEREGSG